MKTSSQILVLYLSLTILKYYLYCKVQHLKRRKLNFSLKHCYILVIKISFKNPFLGNHFVQVTGQSFARIVSSQNFKCESLSSDSQIGLVYKQTGGQVGHIFFLIIETFNKNNTKCFKG